MNKDLTVFSDRIWFLKKWSALLICGLVVGLFTGIFLMKFIAKTTYTNNVTLRIYHPKTKSMNHAEYRKSMKADVQSIAQYRVLVKSATILGIVNNDLHEQHGVIINNVDLGQMYGSGIKANTNKLIVNCTSSSPEVSRWGIKSMAKVIKSSIESTGSGISVDIYYHKKSNPIKQKGNKNVLVYSTLAGLFTTFLLAIYQEIFKIGKGMKYNVIKFKYKNKTRSEE